MSNLKPNIDPTLYKIDAETMKGWSSSENSTKTDKCLPDDVLKQKLRVKAQRYIEAESFFSHRCFELKEEDMSGSVTSTPSVLMVHDNFMKLFEGSYIKNVYQSVADYLFDTTIGYDSYFNCPVIIIRDSEGEVVDLIKYRPVREGYDNLPKYLQEKSINKPKNRGEAFSYPFQIEMQRIIKREKYVFIGEGIKNAVNALVRSVPYISIESASNVRNGRLIDYVSDLYKNGIKIFAAMDGDKAGENAFTEIKKQLKLPLDNLLDFESGLDFTDYLRKESL